MSIIELLLSFVAGNTNLISINYHNKITHIHIAAKYWLTLVDIPEVYVPTGKKSGQFNVEQNFVIRCKERDKLKAHLELKGIETLISWPIPLHKQPALTELHQFNLPVTEEISRTCLSLPMYPELTDEEVNYVIENIRSFFQ